LGKLDFRLNLYIIAGLLILITCEKKDYYQPLLDIISPINGETVRDTVLININTKDEGGIAHVDFFIDDSLYFSDSISLYQYYWDTKKHNNGEHIVKIISTDESGNFAEKRLNVSVNNLPGDYYPEKFEYFYMWDIDIDKPYIYVALNSEGLWRKNYTVENNKWVYMGFTDTVGRKGATSVSAYGKDIIVTSWTEHIWHSLDDGKTWFNTYLNYPYKNKDDHIVIEVERSPHRPNILVSTERGANIFRSEDGGYTWNHVTRSSGVFHGLDGIVWHPYNPEEVWVFSPQSIWVRYYDNLMALNEYGASVKVKVDLKELYLGRALRVFDVFFDSSDKNIIYTLVFGGVFKSIDGGFTWEFIEIDLGENSYLKQVVEDPRTTNSFFITDAHNIYHSKDGLKSVKLVRTFEDELFWVIIKDNIFFYQYDRDIKYIPLDELKPL